MITLIPATNQEAFDMTMRHLRALPRQAMDSENANCAYHLELGSGTFIACAIGNMIKPGDYDWQIEGTSVTALIEHKAIDPGQVDDRLLGRLQGLHDAPGNWLDDKFIAWDRAHWIAVEYHLDESEVHP